MSTELNFPRVSEIIEFKQTQSKDAFITKSGGKLLVPFILPFEIVNKFFNYREKELKKIPEDIRGLREYLVKDLDEGVIGAMEFHRLRNEVVLGISGNFIWECEDVYGDKRSFALTSENGIYTPPFILHTYTVKSPASSLRVICDTLFPLPANPETSDSFSLEKFRLMQNKIQK